MKHLLLLLLVSSVSFAQEPLSPTQLEQAITQGSRRLWKMTTMQSVLSPTDCLDGQIYTFTKMNDRRFLSKQECQNGKWKITNHIWKITQQDGENVLVVDEGKPSASTYPIRLVALDPKKPLQNGNQQLILTVRGQTKGDASTYFYFK